jgi:hypothetical protein
MVGSPHPDAVPAIHRPVQTRDQFVQLFGHDPVPHATALAAGFTRASLDAAVTRGLLTRPHRGVIAAPRCTADGLTRRATPSLSDEERDEHLALLRATLIVAQQTALATYDSAALLQGMARPDSRVPDQLSLGTPDGAGYVGPAARRRGSPIPEHQIVLVDGLRTTSLPRTAIDLARGHHLPSALIPLDSAARLLIADWTGASGNDLRHAVRDPELRDRARDTLRGALGECFGWAGTVRVRTALEHMDPASESALESRSRGWFIEAGLGPLQIGAPIDCAGRRYFADFCDPGRRVIGEADGWSKYGATSEGVREALERERRRAQDLQADGWFLTRWTSTDTRRTVVARMRAALGRRTL